MFRQILECDTLVWVNFKGTGKEFSQGLGVFLGERRIVLDFHLLKVEALVALGHDLILHIDTFMSSPLLLKGKSPKSILYSSTHTAHTSTCPSYTCFLKISGAM